MAKVHPLSVAALDQDHMHFFVADGARESLAHVLLVTGIQDANCSCHDRETAGLLCSHTCAVLQVTGSLEQVAPLIDPRWLLNEIKIQEVRIEWERVAPSPPDHHPGQGLTTKQCYGTEI
jgi:hypothetical protein